MKRSSREETKALKEGNARADSASNAEEELKRMFCMYEENILALKK
jgi:hypothetical protein